MQLVEIFPWNDNFETGVPVIDAQHKHLVRIINLLASHLAHLSGSQILNDVFDQLADYAAYHFKTEEAIWHQYLPEDPLEVEHRETHEDFITAVRKLREEGRDRPFDQSTGKILKFLIRWLVFHILESDMRMAKTVLALQAGKTLPEAKQQAAREMGRAMNVLAESILAMYDTVSAQTLQLTQEQMHRKRLEARLRLAASAVEHTLDGICITDADANIVDVNPAFCEVAECVPGEVLGHHLKHIKTGLADEKLSATIWPAVRERGHWSGVVSSRLNDDDLVTEWMSLSAVKDESGTICNYVAVFSNITRLARKQHQLEELAHQDSLTGLPNRLLLADRLRVSLAHAERNQEYLAVCYLDLDGFKPVNDRFGHAAGDQVLREVSQRLLNVVRKDDTVARLGGDEFVLLLGNLKTPDEFGTLMERVLHEVAQPVRIVDDAVSVTASIGVTVYPLDDADPETLVQHADLAMYQAKQAGKSRFQLYSPERPHSMH